MTDFEWYEYLSELVKCKYAQKNENPLSGILKSGILRCSNAWYSWGSQKEESAWKQENILSISALCRHISLYCGNMRKWTYRASPIDVDGICSINTPQSRWKSHPVAASSQIRRQAVTQRPFGRAVTAGQWLCTAQTVKLPPVALPNIQTLITIQCSGLATWAETFSLPPKPKVLWLLPT